MCTRPVWQTSLATILALVATPLAFGVGSGGTGLKVYAYAALQLRNGVVVNGITFDPSRATITINGEDGHTDDDLLPGMVAGVDGNVVPGLDAGDARLIRVTRVVFGRVEGVGSGGTGLKIARIVVTPRADVVLSGCTASDITVGTTLDVYGYSDGVSGVVDATRIQCSAPSDSVELHGVVSAVATGSIVVNGVSVDLSNAQFIGFGGPIADGDVVAVDGMVSDQGIVAASVTLEPDVNSPNGLHAAVEDAIGALISPLVFVVNAFQVDATNASFSGGTVADLLVGRVVRVQGVIVDGILQAQSVAFDNGESGDGGSDDSTSNGSGDGTSSGSDDGKSSGSDDGASSGSDDGASSGSDDGKPNGSKLHKGDGGKPDKRTSSGSNSDDGNSDDHNSNDGGPNPGDSHGG